MDIESLRVSRNPEEILQMIEKICELKSELVIWQNAQDAKSSSERIVVKALIKSVDSHNRVITFGLKDKSDEFKFSEDRPVFFREEEFKIIFKNNVKVSSKKLMDAELPEEMKLIDRRQYQREFYKVSNEGSSGVMAVVRVKSVADNSWKEFETDVYDISNGGLAVKLRPQIVKFFQEGSEVEISEVRGESFSEKLLGVVSYIKSYEEAKRNHASVFHRMGISFKNEVSLLDSTNS